MHNRTTLNPEEALEYKLVHEIKSQLFPFDAELHTIGEIHQQQVPPGFSFPVPFSNPPQPAPRNENFTSLFDIGFSYTCSY